jgi:hypothetical protein
VAYIGVLLVGLGSALQCLIGSSQVIQTLAQSDRVLQLKGLGLQRLWRDHPQNALAFVACVSALFLLVPSLEDLAVVVSMTFLLCYVLTNISCTLLKVFRNPGWRPAFSAHWAFSAGGCLWALVLMFYLQVFLAFVVLFLALALAMWVQTSGEFSSWGMGLRGMIFHLTLNDLLQRENEEFHQSEGRNILPAVASSQLSLWHPQLLCFIHLADVKFHSKLLHFIHCLQMDTNLCVVAAVLSFDESRNYQTLPASDRCRLFMTTDSNAMNQDLTHQMRRYIQSKMNESGCNGFIKVCTAPSVEIGQSLLLETIGLGDLSPDTVITAWPLESHHNVMLPKIKELFYLWKNNDFSSIVCKGIRHFPRKGHQMHGFLDVWWLMGASQILILIAFILRQSQSTLYSGKL